VASDLRAIIALAKIVSPNWIAPAPRPSKIAKYRVCSRAVARGAAPRATRVISANLAM
jgi:hypothetical protein